MMNRMIKTKTGYRGKEFKESDHEFNRDQRNQMCSVRVTEKEIIVEGVDSKKGEGVAREEETFRINMRRESARWTSLQSIRQSSRGCDDRESDSELGDGLFNVASSLDIRDEDVAFEGRPPNQNSISRSRRRQNAQARFSRRLHGPYAPFGTFLSRSRIGFQYNLH